MIPFLPAPAARLFSTAPVALPARPAAPVQPVAEVVFRTAEKGTAQSGGNETTETPDCGHGPLFAMPSPGGSRSVRVAVGAMLAALALIPFTGTTASVIRDSLRAFPGKSAYASFTQLPSAVNLLTVVAVIWLLDVRRRAALVYLAAAFAVSGLVVEPMKQIFGRARPETSVLLTENVQSRMIRLVEEYPVLGEAMAPAGTGTRGDRWLFLTTGRPYFKDVFASFPSGHAMSAFIMAGFLCALYPRGRWLWILLAAGCALARIRARRHFIDDVLFSAGLGWLITCWVFRWQWPARIARRLGLDRQGAA